MGQEVDHQDVMEVIVYEKAVVNPLHIRYLFLLFANES